MPLPPPSPSRGRALLPPPCPLPSPCLQAGPGWHGLPIVGGHHPCTGIGCSYPPSGGSVTVYAHAPAASASGGWPKARHPAATPTA
eukprot:12938501-Prorocentrum_lima.AAC.1